MVGTQTYPNKFIWDSERISESELKDSVEMFDVNEILASILSPDDFFIVLVWVSTCTLKLKLDDSIEMLQPKKYVNEVTIPNKEHI